MRSIKSKYGYKDLDRVDYTPGQPPLVNRESHKRKRVHEEYQEEYLDELAEELIIEAWGIASRRKQAINLRRNKHKVGRGRIRARSRIATNPILQHRATRRARVAVTKKYLKGRNKSDVSYAQKADVELKVRRAAPRVKIIQKRLLPKVRADDRRR